MGDPENGVFLLAALIGLYIVPGVVASYRKHRQSAAIWVLNLLAGWTFIGWVGALVWACSNSAVIMDPQRPLATWPLLRSSPRRRSWSCAISMKLRRFGTVALSRRKNTA